VDRPLAEQVAVVTGSSRGIGAAIAEALAQAGATVVVTGRDQTSAEQVVANIAGDRGLAWSHVLDVTRRKSIEALAAEVQQRHGRLDILVNNAGVNPIFTRLEKVKEADWDTILDTNLKGAFLCCQVFGPAMVARRRGCVVNVSSVLARSGYARMVPYCASKGGLEAFSRALALEWAPHNVRVNCVCPAMVETELTEGLRANPDLSKQALERTPLGEFARPADVVGAVVFLCSHAARYVTGTTLDVDGGWLAQ
jgi:NAD(P)-dependent dehydrogenase (short-subunit alcohol dehydrogenase family)